MPDRRNGHTHTLSVRLESKEGEWEVNNYTQNLSWFLSLNIFRLCFLSKALRVYQDHPLHVKMKKECVLPVLAEPPMAVDYESSVVLGDTAK